MTTNIMFLRVIFIFIHFSIISCKQKITLKINGIGNHSIFNSELVKYNGTYPDAITINENIFIDSITSKVYTNKENKINYIFIFLL